MARPEGWPKTLGDFGFREARFSAISGCPIRLAADYRFRPDRRHSTARGGLSGRLTCAGLWQCLPVIPGHPVRRVLGQFLGVFLQFDQVLEGIDAV